MAAGGTRTLRIVIAGDGSGGIRAFESLNGAADRAGRGLDDAGRRGGASFAAFGAVALKGAKIAALGTAAVAAGAGLAAVGVYKLGRGYEQNLNVLLALNKGQKGGIESLAEFRSGIEANKGVINKYGYDLDEASAALVELNKAGRIGKDGIAALTPTLELARGGGIDLANAATLVSNALNVFGARSGGAANVTNVLANAANLSSASVADLGVSMQMSSSVAAQAGLNMEEMGASLAILANNGLKGSDAGTSLKTMLLRLRTPVEKSKKALDELGVSVYDSQGKMKPLAQIVDDLNISMSGLSDEEKAQAMYRIFGSDAIRSGTILMKEGGNALRQMSLDVDKAGGAAAVANAKTEGLGGAFDRMRAMAKSAAQQLYVTFAPTLGAAINGMLDNIGNIGKALQALAEGRVLIFAEKMDAVFGANGTTLRFFATVGNLVTSFRSAFEGAMDGAGNKAGFFAKAGEKIRAIWTEIQPVISEFVGFVRSTLVPAFMDILNKARPTFDQLKKTVMSALDAIKVAFTVVVTVIKALWSVFGGFLISTVKGFIGGIMTAIKGGLQIIQGLLDVFVGLFTGDWSRMWSGIVSVAKGIFNVIIGLFTAWLNFGILGAVRRGVMLIVTGFKTGLMAMVRAPLTIFNAIKSAFFAFLNGIKTRVTGEMGATGGIFRRAWEAIKVIFRFSGGQLLTILVQALTRMIGAFSGMPARFASFGRSIIEGLIQGVKAMAGQAIQAVQNIAGNLVDAAKSALKINSPSKVMIPIGASVGEGLAVGILGSGGMVEEAVKTVANLVKDIPLMGGTYGVSGGDLAAAEGRANQQDVDKSKATRDSAASDLAAKAAAASAAATAVAGMSKAYAEAERRMKAAEKATAAVKAQTDKKIQTLKDKAQALSAESAAQKRRADLMPATTKAQKAARDAVLNHAKALDYEAKKVRQAITDAQEEQKVRVAAAKKHEDAVEKASKKVIDAYAKAKTAAKESKDSQLAAANELAEAQMDLADKVYEKQKAMAIAQAEAAQATALTAAEAAKGVYDAQMEVVNGVVDQVKGKLQEMVNEANSLRDAFAKGVMGTVDLLGAFKDETIATADDMVSYLTGKLQAAQAFAENLAALTAKGLDTGLIAQLAAAGPEAGAAMAKALLAATPETLSKVNDLTVKIGETAATGVEGIVKQLYGPGAAALASYVAGLRSNLPELQKVLDEVNAMVSSINGAKASAMDAAAGVAAAAAAAQASASQAQATSAAAAAQARAEGIKGGDISVSAEVTVNAQGNGQVDTDAISKAITKAVGSLTQEIYSGRR